MFSEEKQQAIKSEIEIKYLIFNTEQELKELLFKIQSVKMFSIEPILNQENKILGIGITISLEESYYIEWNKTCFNRIIDKYITLCDFYKKIARMRFDYEKLLRMSRM